MADVLRVVDNARLRLTRDGVTHYNLVHTPTAESYTEYASDRLVLAVSSGVVQASLGGVTAGEHLMLTTDQPIKVGVSSQTFLWTVNKFLKLTGSITSLYFENESSEKTATVEFIVTD